MHVEPIKMKDPFVGESMAEFAKRMGFGRSAARQRRTAGGVFNTFRHDIDQDDRILCVSKAATGGMFWVWYIG